MIYSYFPHWATIALNLIPLHEHGGEEDASMAQRVHPLHRVCSSLLSHCTDEHETQKWSNFPKDTAEELPCARWPAACHLPYSEVTMMMAVSERVLTWILKTPLGLILLSVSTLSFSSSTQQLPGSYAVTQTQQTPMPGAQPQGFVVGRLPLILESTNREPQTKSGLLPAFENKILLGHGSARSLTMADFKLQGQNWVVVMETIWPTEPKMPPSPLQERLPDPWLVAFPLRGTLALMTSQGLEPWQIFSFIKWIGLESPYEKACASVSCACPIPTTLENQQLKNPVNSKILLPKGRWCILWRCFRKYLVMETKILKPK